MVRKAIADADKLLHTSLAVQKTSFQQMLEMMLLKAVLAMTFCLVMP
jgi:hypothetical protein